MVLLKKIISEKFLLTLVVGTNAFYLLSCIYSPSSLLLIVTFIAEAAYLFRYHNRLAIISVYRDISPLLSLIKISLYLLYGSTVLVILVFLVLESCLLILYRAGYYFNFQATAVPCLNYKNFGRLTELNQWSERLNYFVNANYIRPLTHFFGCSFLFLLPKYNAQAFGLFMVVIMIAIAWLAASTLRYFIYSNSATYKKDLKSHAEFHSPQVIMYVSGAPGSSYQLAQWIPVLEKLDQRVTVIARERFWIDDLRDSPLHTVFAKGLEDINTFLTEESKVCLYPANAFKNTQMMRRSEMEHVFINHGESDKIVNVSRLIRAYSRLYLAGPMAKDRLEDAGISLSENQYTYVGRPQTSIFLEDSRKQTGNILYAPTWEGFDTISNYNSIEKLALEILENIVTNTDFNILFKPHPLTGRVQKKLQKELEKIKVFLANTGRGEYIAGGNILKTMNNCDILITDISSVMNDFLATSKPYIVTNPLGISTTSFEKQFLTVQGGYILNTPSDIHHILESIGKDDPKKDERSRVRNYSLGEFTCSDLDKFKKEITSDCR